MIIKETDVYINDISTSVQSKKRVSSLFRSTWTRQPAGTYLVTELSHNLVQSVRLLGEILSLGEQVLGGLEGTFAARELVHGERHRGHVLRPFDDIVVLLQSASALLPLFRFGVHLRRDQLHLETRLGDLRLLLAVQPHRLQRLARRAVFLKRVVSNDHTPVVLWTSRLCLVPSPIIVA